MVVAAALSVPMACSTGAKEPPAAAVPAPAIVWPAPPDPPRVKFVESIRSNRDVEGRTKRNLKEILLGIDPDRLAVALKRPLDLATDSKGRVLVVDAGAPGVHTYDRQARSFELYGTNGEGGLAWPIGIAVDQHDAIYVTDHAQKRLVKYDSAGRFLFAVKDFLNPVGVAVDPPRSRVVVVDSQAHALKIYDLEGREQDVIGERGKEEGQFNFPTYCDFDTQGSLYVMDTGNHRVQVFNADLEVVGSFGSVGVHPGQFTRPKGIAVDRHGIIYVVDGAFNNVQMFDPEFRLLMPFGTGGEESGQFTLPVGIHVDERGMIYVADFGNARIQVLQLLAEGLEEPAPVNKTETTGPAGASR
jgi:DNA-binding beta-propeller fold protein YncE